MAAFLKNLFGGGGASLPTPPPPIAPPQPDVQAQVDAAAARKRRMGLTAPANAGTLLTGPSGVTAPAATAKPTLLGQ